jgi:hypothetical protein
VAGVTRWVGAPPSTQWSGNEREISQQTWRGDKPSGAPNRIVIGREEVLIVQKTCDPRAELGSGLVQKTCDPRAELGSGLGLGLRLRFQLIALS